MTRHITPDMTLLDIVHKHRAAEAVFRARDEQAGECLLCKALFETVADVAARYGLDLDALMADLEAAISEEE
ncbi:hypothetical protein BerOc1_01954 [Pseudodesulfovibrio hydrargyri]|uniref:DUF1858 domain-containing protein n=1 Tax=Pseudodesulfovibrio hydrargyri TaxID=2125990 RepID=A0A1J5N596_9BACT|nr:hypothetical protein [Pseudodesulfovibrio hydrargyri]OIQ50024.1 hypothetical protein BerOc1_01954 [Pseudodesulfovibrio hydrargyri]